MRIQPKISLHLGVHKTATTYTQSKLWNSREELKKNGINYIQLDDLRKRLTSKLNNSSFGEKGVFDALYPFLNCDRLIISDENILGGTNLPKKQSLYVDAKKRVKKVVEGLEGCEVDIYITIRNFSDYLISRYSESLRHFGFCTFEEYLAELDEKNISWLPTLYDLSSLNCNTVYVNDFSYTLNGDEYLQKLIGKKVRLSDASQGSWVRRSKISQEAYNLIKLYSETYSDKSARKLMILMDNNPQSTEANPFMPFHSEQLSRLKTKYSEELDVIKNDNSFVYLGK